MLAIEPRELDVFFFNLTLFYIIFSLNIGNITSIKSPIINQKNVHMSI